MVYNLTSIKRVIAKVYLDLQLSEDTYPINDFLEWASEAVERLGVAPALVTKTTGKNEEPYTILKDHFAKLPLDLFRINQIAYSKTSNGLFYPMRYSTGSMDNWGSCPYDDNFSEPNAIAPMRSGVFTEEPVYVVKPGYINSNARNGYLMISYQAIQLDEEGYPYIPDMQSYIDAIYWYILMKYFYAKWIRNEISEKIYYDAKSSWNYYCKQAVAEMLMPNMDQMESIKNVWVRLIPEINAHNTFYSTIGEQEYVRDKNAYIGKYYGKL